VLLGGVPAGTTRSNAGVVASTESRVRRRAAQRSDDERRHEDKDRLTRGCIWPTLELQEMMTYTVEGNTISLTGTTVVRGKETKMRGTTVFASGGRRFVYNLEMSGDGNTWVPASEMTFMKVT
jgi:hypothetical protein